MISKYVLFQTQPNLFHFHRSYHPCRAVSTLSWRGDSFTFR